jgi:cell division protein FtsL
MHRTINWILMLLTLASTFALYAIKYDTRRLEARVQGQERALERAENDVTVLTAERAHLARPERLEPLARQLGLAPISGSQYLRLEFSSGVPSPLVEEGQGGGETRRSSGPPTPNPSPQALGPNDGSDGAILRARGQGGGESAPLSRHPSQPPSAR